MTLADEIRQMSDEDLAVLFYSALSDRDSWWIERLKWMGVSATQIDMPILSIKNHLSMLRKEVD